MKKMRKIHFKIVILLVLLFSASLLAGCQSSMGIKEKVSVSDPVSLRLWHYYNGPQKEAFEHLVTEFNETLGMEKGITVELFSQGSVNELTDALLNAVNKKVGADEVPDIFSGYADTAYQVDQLGMVANLDMYLTDKEIDNYIPGYMEEGRFDRDGNLKIFPFAKSTEVLLLNKTDWDKYAAETGANIDQLKTFEGLTETAKKYYEWSGGKAFLGRDAFANYMIIGSKQLGTEIFEVKDGTVHVNLDEKIMRQLWDNYYVPYINGYFVSNGRFASDDAKTGSVIAVVGSTSSATYFPTKVTISDTENYQIETMVLEAPVFNEGKRVAVQQGAGMVVTKSDERREDAAAVFLKWLTEPDHNINFSITSGYLPVTIEANKKDRIKAEIEKSGEAVISDTLKKTLSAAVDTTNNSELYTNKAFEKGTEARAVLENSMKDKAKADRAAVEALIKSGVSTQEAAAQFDTDDNFKQWFNRLRNDLDKAVQ